MDAHTATGQRIWGGKIAVYLFLAGMGAGAYCSGVLADLAGHTWRPVATIGVLLGPPLVALGTLFLLWDLGKPWRFWRAATRPGSSWIARGVYILSAFVLLGALHIATWIWPFIVLAQATPWRWVLAGASGLAALLTMVYTGLLLGGMRPLPLWSNPMIPLLFLVSALSTGLMLVDTVFLAASSALEPARRLAQLDAVLLVAEAFIVLFYIQTLHATTAARASVALLLRGELAPAFWIGVVGLGILLPLGAELVHVALLSRMHWLWYAITVALPGLAGGLCLRYLVLAAGIRAPLQVAGMQVALPARARF